MDDKISVIMACYNCEKTLTKAIDSILNQTYKNWIMICCDDGSKDNTWNLLLNYKKNYPDKFILIQNDENKKLPYSLNHCLKFVETNLVARMDADDWSMPNRFEIQLNYLKENPEIDLVGTGIIISDGENEIGEIIQPSKPKKEDMLHCNCFSHATIMTYKKVYDKLNGYSLERYVERCEDLDLWSRFFAAGFNGANIPDKLYAIYEDDNAVRRRDLKNRFNTAKTLMKAYERMGLKGLQCYKKAYLQVLTYFVPISVYKKLHIWKINQRNKANSNK